MRAAHVDDAQPLKNATPKWVLPALVAVYCLLTLLLIVRVPLGGAPDETAHFEYVQHLATHRSWPVFLPLGANHPGYEFHQPPLYYVVCAPLWYCAGPSGGAYACRLVSMAFGAATLVLLWGAARALFPRDFSVAALATGLAALLPLHIAVGASGGNDTAAGFFCAAMFFCLARCQARPTTRDSVLLGCIVGLGMLSKSTALGAALPATLAIAAYAACQGGKLRLKAAAATAATVVAMALLVCGWWLLRNQRLYGDPFAARIFGLAFSNSSPRPSDFMTDGRIFVHGVSLFTYLRALVLVMFCTTWGFFGGLNTALAVLNPFGTRGPGAEIIPMMLPMVACAAATAAALWGLLGALGGLDQIQRMRCWAWASAMVCVFLVWGRFNLIHFQAQARYVHPALLPCALFAALGWRHLVFNRLSRTTAAWVLTSLFACLLIGITLWNAWGWRTLV